MKTLTNLFYEVYIHKNLINGKMYVGQAINYDGWNTNKRFGHNGYKYMKQPLFGKALKKYGWNNFEHKIIATGLTKSEANWLENYLICYYRTYVGFSDCKGYNCTLGGEGTIGYICSEETRKKLSKVHKGKSLSEEHKRHLSESQKGEKARMWGKHLSEETKQKISQKHNPLNGAKKVHLYENGVFIQTFVSEKECAKFIGCNTRTIWRYFKVPKPVFKKYTFNRVRVQESENTY